MFGSRNLRNKGHANIKGFTVYIDLQLHSFILELQRHVNSSKISTHTHTTTHVTLQAVAQQDCYTAYTVV